MAIAGFVRKMSGTSEVDTDTMNRAVSKMVEVIDNKAEFQLK